MAAGSSTFRGFEKLRVYELAERLADSVWTIVAEWSHLAKETVGKQLIRSADSIGSNIAEGTGRGSYQDNRRFVRNARGSLYETRHWLRRAHARHLMSPEAVKAIKPIVDELSPKLNAYLRSIGESLRTDAHNAEAKDKGPGTNDQ